MSEKPENPYIYPSDPHIGNQFVANDGMSLRDYFAASVMGALMTCAANKQLKIDNPAAILSSDAYLFADAMLKARGEV